jgi:hypothetical protein
MDIILHQTILIFRILGAIDFQPLVHITIFYRTSSSKFVCQRPSLGLIVCDIWGKVKASLFFKTSPRWFWCSPEVMKYCYLTQGHNTLRQRQVPGPRVSNLKPSLSHHLLRCSKKSADFWYRSHFCHCTLDFFSYVRCRYHHLLYRTLGDISESAS